MAGEWRCASRLTGLATPLGVGLAPTTARRQPEGADSELVFTSRWLPTEGGAVADLAFNFRSLSEAQLRRPGAVTEVQFDERENRLRATFLGGTKCELYLSAFRADAVTADPFHTAECSRYVTRGDGGAASDSQVLSRFARADGGRVLLSQKVALYLTPLDADYFEAGGRAVAVLRYETELSPAL